MNSLLLAKHSRVSMAKFSKSVVTGLILVILIATLLIQSATVKADWTMFRHDPAHTGAEASNPVLTHTMLWNFTPTNANTTDQYQQYIATDWSSPAIVNGVVYIGHERVQSHPCLRTLF